MLLLWFQFHCFQLSLHYGGQRNETRCSFFGAKFPPHHTSGSHRATASMRSRLDRQESQCGATLTLFDLFVLINDEEWTTYAFNSKCHFRFFRWGVPPSWTQVKATSCMNGELTSTWKQPSVKSKNNNTIYRTFRLSWQWHPDRQTTSLRSSNYLSSSISEDFLRFFHISSINQQSQLLVAAVLATGSAVLSNAIFVG